MKYYVYLVDNKKLVICATKFAFPGYELVYENENLTRCREWKEDVEYIKTV